MMQTAGSIQSLVIGQNNTSGPAVEVSTIIGVSLSGGSSGSAKTVFTIAVPFSNAVLDSTYAQQINNAPVIKMSAGQAIAFEGTNSNRLLYDGTTNTLRWNQGTLSYVVGKGIAVGWVNVYSTSTTLPNYISGNMIFLIGANPYTITLPPASTVAAGTGYTFSVTGTGPVNILPNGTDAIDSGPIVLHLCDRYHIVSDGSGLLARSVLDECRFAAVPGPDRAGVLYRGKSADWNRRRREGLCVERTKAQRRSQAQEAAWRCSSMVSTGFLRAVAPRSLPSGSVPSTHFQVEIIDANHFRTAFGHHSFGR